jgi:hypothetical protein
LRSQIFPGNAAGKTVGRLQKGAKKMPRRFAPRPLGSLLTLGLFRRLPCGSIVCGDA